MPKNRTLVVVTGLLAVVASASCGRPAHIASPVTEASIRKITPGMRRSEVHGLLGSPLREGRGAGGPLLEYAICGAAVRSIGFWISLDVEDRVNTVHVKQCPLIADNYAIYEARIGEPVYEHPDFSRILGKRQ